MVPLTEKPSMKNKKDVPQQPTKKAVKLPPFWSANPAAWFTTTEGTFKLRGIADERSCFFLNSLHALPETTVILMYQISIKNIKPMSAFLKNFVGSESGDICVYNSITLEYALHIT
jgi:hypothetical protein